MDRLPLDHYSLDHFHQPDLDRVRRAAVYSSLLMEHTVSNRPFDRVNAVSTQLTSWWWWTASMNGGCAPAP